MNSFDNNSLDNKYTLSMYLEVETMTQETIKVEGMSCGHCVMRVKKAVEAVEGVQKADVNLENKQVIVEYEKGKENLEKVKAAIREAGYEPL
jgi:copper chaperone